MDTYEQRSIKNKTNCAESNIGIFDSGVGGVTVLKKLLEHLPSENYIYFGDNGNAPYGEKSQKNIEAHCFKIADFLKENNSKIIVIACNTATVASYESLKSKYNIPIIGIVENGAKEAAANTKNNKIGVLATPFTANSHAYKKEIEKLNPDLEVYESGCKMLCPMIESGWTTHSDRLEFVHDYLSVIPNDCDTLVLGCTHYPIIKSDIEKFFSGKIVDPADYMAKSVKEYLEENNLLEKSESTKNNKKNGELIFYTSGEVLRFRSIAESFLNRKIENISFKKL